MTTLLLVIASILVAIAMAPLSGFVGYKSGLTWNERKTRQKFYAFASGINILSWVSLMALSFFLLAGDSSTRSIVGAILGLGYMMVMILTQETAREIGIRKAKKEKEKEKIS